jgi:hypothetical protein
VEATNKTLMKTLKKKLEEWKLGGSPARSSVVIKNHNPNNDKGNSFLFSIRVRGSHPSRGRFSKLLGKALQPRNEQRGKNAEPRLAPGKEG